MKDAHSIEEYVKTLDTEVIEQGEATADLAEQLLNIESTIKINSADIHSLHADFADIDHLVARKADIGQINADWINSGTLTADRILLKSEDPEDGTKSLYYQINAETLKKHDINLDTLTDAEVELLNEQLLEESIFSKNVTIDGEEFTTLQQYAWIDENGLHFTKTPKEIFEEDPSGGNTVLDSDGLYIKKGSDTISSFTQNRLRIGKDNNIHAEIQIDDSFSGFKISNNALVDSFVIRLKDASTARYRIVIGCSDVTYDTPVLPNTAYEFKIYPTYPVDQFIRIWAVKKNATEDVETIPEYDSGQNQSIYYQYDSNDSCYVVTFTSSNTYTWQSLNLQYYTAGFPTQILLGPTANSSSYFGGDVSFAVGAPYTNSSLDKSNIFELDQWGNMYIEGKVKSNYTGSPSFFAAHGNTGYGTYYQAKRTDTGVSALFGVGSGGTNHGVYSVPLDNWIAYSDGTYVYLGGGSNKLRLTPSNGSVLAQGSITAPNLIGTNSLSVAGDYGISSTGRVTGSGFRVSNHASNIGTILTASKNGTSYSLANTTSFDEFNSALNIELTPGTWVITGKISFAAATSGRRGVGIRIDTTNEASSTVQVPCVSSSSVSTNVQTTYIHSSTSSVLAKLCYVQNSGSALNGTGYIKAVRIA